MKNFILFLFCSFIVVDVTAQYPKHIVRLRDKGSNAYSLANPAAYLSPRAIQRRTRYNIPLDSADLPISQRYLDSLARVPNVTILSNSKWLNQVLIQTTSPTALAKVNSFPFVVATQGVGNRVAQAKLKKLDEQPKDTIINTTVRTAADVFNYGTSYDQVHMHDGEFLHNRGFRGETMQVAVLDAGFMAYKNITAFDSVRMNGQVLGEKDFVDFDNSVNEDNSHGMFCFSILAANWPNRLVGSAPKAKYWLLRTENALSEFPIEEHNWVVGAEFADSTGSDMISSSLGYYDFDDPSFNHTYNDFYRNSTMVTRGATTAAKKGMIVMNSAGNEGGSAWKYLGFPADADSVCAVGAVARDSSIASFSSFGYPGKVKPNIVSLGVATAIANFNNQPTFGNGTSFSNPNVAGLIACLWQAFPRFNNMQILDAVYRSSNRYNAPTDRFGFGIPNFRKAYQILKKNENTILYGNDWIFATPNPFTSQIDVKFIGRIDGPATLELINPQGQVIGTRNFITEIEEVYDYSFLNLGSAPDGIYTVRYSDGSTSRMIALQKGSSNMKDWLMALPNPFNNRLIVYLRAPESGDVAIRLVDTKGAVVDVIEINTTLNQTRTMEFENAPKLQRGPYFVQYVGKTIKRTIKLVKQ